MPEESTALDDAIGGSRDHRSKGEHLRVVEYLLSQGGDPNIGRPIISAINHEDSALALQFVKLLVEHGADVNKPFDSYRRQNMMFTALDWAAGKPEIAAYLKEHGAKPAHELVGAERAMVKPTPPVPVGDSLFSFCEQEFGTPEPQALIEIVPKDPPITVWVVHPDKSGEHVTLFTQGMSAQPMPVPDMEGADTFRFAEVFIQLPIKWAYRELSKPNWSWPIEWLRKAAKYPHQTGKWFGPVSILDNGDPPKPLAPNTKFDSLMVLAEKEMVDKRGKTYRLYRLNPLYPEERVLAKKKGIATLTKALDKKGIGFVVDLKRANAAK
jgi:hypothetical protein